MREHVVRSHKRGITKSRGYSVLPPSKRLTHVRSYRRGNEKPQTKLLVKPKPVSIPVDPLRKKAEELVDSKLQEVMKNINSNKGPYWKKIADFQLNYKGKTWKVIDSYDTGGYGDYEDCQLCGHKNCRYIYVISSGDSKLNIGSECVYNYTQDVDAKKVFREHEKRLKNSIGKTKSYRDLLVELLLWENRNGTNDFLRDMKSRIMNGVSLSPNMVSAIKRTISKEKPKEVVSENKKILELFSRARSKPSNDWERGFIISIGEQLQKGRTLSLKQVALLERIANYR